MRGIGEHFRQIFGQLISLVPTQKSKKDRIEQKLLQAHVGWNGGHPHSSRLSYTNESQLQANCDSCRYFFFTDTILSWNNLPFSIEKVDRVEGFKLKLKKHTI